MSQNLEKEFVSAGVQSPSEFEGASDELTTKLVSHRTVPAESPKSRVDSTVQTQNSVSELKPLRNKNQKTLLITLENCCNGKQVSHKVNSKGTRNIKKKSKGMDNNPESGATRTMSDLERKKLEAELKATEQIAKIKQSVIEKRLELELASLQDDYNPNIRSLQQSANNELKVLENCLERNENGAEVEHRGPPYRNPLLPSSLSPALASAPVQVSRSPFQPSFSPPVPPLNQYHPRNYPKTKSSKNDSDFLIKNEIKSLKLSPISTGNYEQRYPRPGNLGMPQRNMVLPERGRFMQTIEKPKYPPPPNMEKNPFKSMEETKYVQQPQVPVTETYYANRIPDGNANLHEDLQEPGCSLGMANENNANSIWKVLMSKMKKKMKRQPPPWQ